MPSSGHLLESSEKNRRHLAAAQKEREGEETRTKRGRNDEGEIRGVRRGGYGFEQAGRWVGRGKIEVVEV